MRHRNLSILMILGLLLVMPRFAYAYSFEGDDWFVNMTGTLRIGSLIDEPVNLVNEPISIGQTSNEEITIPLVIPDPINETFDVPGTVSGTYVHCADYLAEYGPITTDYGEILLKEIDAQLDGDATGINPLDMTGDYGARVYYITGLASPDSKVTAEVWMKPFDDWIHVGNAELEITSWNAERGEGVPEPGTIVMLLGLAASLAGYGWLRRR